MNRIARVAAAVALAAFAAIAGLTTTLPARAGTIVYSGSNCILDGVSSLPGNGALHNEETGSASTSKLHCPLQRTGPLVISNTASVRINVLRNLTGASWNCVLRSIDRGGQIIDADEVFIAPWNGTGSNAYSAVTGLVSSVWPAVSYSLRCNMPNKAGNTAAIVSYELIE